MDSIDWLEENDNLESEYNSLKTETSCGKSFKKSKYFRMYNCIGEFRQNSILCISNETVNFSS